MLILPKSQAVSHSSLPSYPPFFRLMLPAPQIAGLLGPGSQSQSQSHTQSHTLPAAEPQPFQRESASYSTSFSASYSASSSTSVPTFTFSDPSLAALDPDQRQKLFDAAQTLLEVAVRFSTGELNHHALRAAQVLFHRRLTGHSPARPLTPTSYRAEQDAEMIDLMLSFEKRPRYDSQAAHERMAQAWADIAARKAANHG